MNNDDVTDPKENPEETGHLPVSGEGGVGQVPYRDPVTADTDDGLDSLPDMNTPDQQLAARNKGTDNIEELGNKRIQPGADNNQMGEDSTIQ